MGKRFRQLTQTATDADFVEGNYFGVDTPSVTKKVPANLVAKASEQATLTTYSQNVAHSIAPEYNGSATAGKLYMHDGVLYKCKENTSGDWNSSKFELKPVEEIVNEIKEALDPLSDLFHIVESNEYMCAIADRNDKILIGINKDGSVDWQKGIPQPIKEELYKINKILGMFAISSDSIEVTEMLLYSLNDKNGVPLFWISKDGSLDWQKGVPQPIENRLRPVEKITNCQSIDESQSEAVDVFRDAEEKVIEYTDKRGIRHFETEVKFDGGIYWDAKLLSELESALRVHGFSGGGGDWTDKDYISLPKPRCAIVNFTGLESFPLTKGSDVPCIMEFWDGNGNYFKKFAIVNPQGNSTLQWPKKNIAVDLYNDEAREDSCKVKFGDWPAFDSYHIKAYYNDFFRCIGCISYDIIDEIWKSRGPLHDAPRKDALIDQENYPEGKLMFGAETDYDLRQDTGALCHPMGFPSVVYLNGDFWGVFPFQIKKHRDNYHQKKSNTKHIHLDGVLGNGNLFGAEGDVEWTSFEIRNPKDLIDMDGNKYDGDDPKELIDSTSPAWTGSSKQVNTQKVKQAVLAVSEISGELAEAVTSYGVNSAEFKTLFETYYDVDNIIDWAIFLDFWYNRDGLVNNTQWITYNGVKWWATPYDIDIAFGWYSPWVLNNTSTPLGRDDSTLPIKFIFDNDDYRARAEARYKALRDSGILTLDNVINKINNFVKSVGMDFFKKEYEKWPGTASDRDTSVNTEYWSLDLDGEGKPIYGDNRTWDSNASYNIGDQVYQGYNAEMGYVRFTAVKAGAGNNPVTLYGIHDSIWRVAKWMERHIGYCDANYNYT